MVQPINICLFSFLGKCNETQFQCKTGECKYDHYTNCKGSCIPTTRLNNGIKDCSDGSDEPLTGKILMRFYIYSRICYRDHP